MPIPTPKAGEGQDAYVGRCMAATAGDDMPRDQRLAACFGRFRERSSRSVELPSSSSASAWGQALMLRTSEALGEGADESAVAAIQAELAAEFRRRHPGEPLPERLAPKAVAA